MLARVGVPDEIIAVIHHFHDGMQARIRMDDGELFGWFEVTEGLRKGRVLYPPVFNIFFAAALDLVLVRLSEDDVILENMIYLEAERRGRHWNPYGARCGVMLYINNAGTVPGSADLARMTTLIVGVLGAFGLTVSEKTAETLLMRVPEKLPKKNETLSSQSLTPLPSM